MNKFRYYSDLHGFNPDFKRVTDKYEICIIAGDSAEFSRKGTKLFEMASELCERFLRVIWVPGNHDYYGTNIDTLESKFRKLMEGYDNFILLQNGEYVDIDEVRIIGATLWSDSSKCSYDAKTMMNDYKYIRFGPKGKEWQKKLNPAMTTYLHHEHLRNIKLALEDWKGDSIVVTHHAPSKLSLDPRYEGSPINDCYATDVELDVWPNYWIHGHIHKYQNYILNGCNIRCNPGGYSGEYTGFQSLNNYFYL